VAAFNFPNSPSTNQTHTENGVTFKWDGEIWKRAGIAGAQGAQGSTGSQGVQGAVGTQGHQGVQGAPGPQGHQGVQGAVGAQGHQGRQGAVGAQGVQGAQGAQGATGAQGHQGVQGAVGAQGAGGSATISNNADNRVITGGSGTNLNGEADLTFNGTKLKLNDEKAIHFGTNDDLKISHTNSLASQNDSNGDSVVDGWTSYIEDAGTGGIVFKSDGNTGEGAFQFFDTSWRPIVRMFSGSSARAILYHAGSEKFVTDAGGISITGGIKDKDGDLGSAGQVLSSTGTQLNWVANTAGAQGAVGAQGAQGVQGATGSGGGAGAQGAQGHQGVQGAQGHQGVQGAQGAVGAQGVQGAQGHQGVQGAQGAAAAGPNGKLLKYATTSYTSHVTFSNDTWTDVGLSIAYTPVSSNSKILLKAYIDMWPKSKADSSANSWARWKWRMQVDGSTIGQEQYNRSGYGYSSTYMHYNTEKRWQWHFYREYSNSSTSQKTFKIQLYETGDAVLEMNKSQDGGSPSSFFTITEVQN